MEKLMEYNLPFRTRDTVPNLYEHWISRNILTYIRIAMGSRAREDILQVSNPRYHRIKNDTKKQIDQYRNDPDFHIGRCFIFLS